MKCTQGRGHCPPPLSGETIPRGVLFFIRSEAHLVADSSCLDSEEVPGFTASIQNDSGLPQGLGVPSPVG
jgi:hypothetical protein